MFGILSVALGAFGAHSLKRIVSPESVAGFETGVRYQFYHTLALLAVALIYERFSNKWVVWSGYSFLIGIVLFSGSLYLLTALNATNTVGLRKAGIITPFGGLFFIAGWVLLLTGILKRS